MGYWIAAIVFFVIVAAVVSSLKKGRGGRRQDGPSEPGAPTKERSPFKRNKFFLTTAEQSFFGCLKHVVAGRFELFAKVRLLDVLWLPPDAQSKQRWRNMVQSKHVDFLLCDSKTLLPLVAVELDDSSHNRGDRQDRDDLVDGVLEAAGLPILRVTARSAYDTRALGEEIMKRIGTSAQAAAAIQCSKGV